MPRVAKDLRGLRVGRLRVLEQAVFGAGRTAWKCKCDCGNFTVVRAVHLTRKEVHLRTKSCGCLRHEGSRRTHGDAGTPLYARWNAMKQRCHNPENRSYPSYGGRGIKVCRSWHRWESFKAWALANGYAPHLSLDRIDNEGDYKPSNCRWTTHKKQARNRRHLKLTPNDVQNIKSRAMSAQPGEKAALAREYGVSAPTISDIIAGRTWDRS